MPKHPTPIENQAPSPAPDASTPGARSASSGDAAPSNAKVRLRTGVCAIALLAILLATGVIPRMREARALTSQVEADAAQTVTVVTPEKSSSTQDLQLPGTVSPYINAPIYARVSGYLENWYTDIGTHVKAGQLLARISAPELDAQLQQARADAATAQANFTFAAITAKRWREMLRTQSVAQQDVDAKVSDMQAKRALLLAATANVDRLSQLVSYERIVAPFDGVVTARNIDIGALVSAGDVGSSASTGGAGTQGAALFNLQQTSRLRVYVDVPQSDAAAVHTNPQAWIETSQRPGVHVPAIVTRNADALDPSSRTLRVELAVNNADDTLLSGSYVAVHLALFRQSDVLKIPDSTLLFRANGVNVATVDSTNHAVLKQIHLGRDFGTSADVLSGLAPGDRIINNPADSLQNGQLVKIETSSHG